MKTMNPAVSFCVHSLRLKARTAAEATQSRHGTAPSFSTPCNGNSPAFPQTAASAPPWTARAYTAAPRKGRRTVRLEPFRYRRRKRFPANPPCPGPRRRPGRSCGARAPCGRWTELFLLCSCPYCRLRLFPGQDPLSGRPSGGGKTVSPGIPRRRRSLSGKPPAGFQARSQFLKGNGSIQTEAHPVFLIHMVGRKTAAIIRKNPGLTGTNPQVQNLHPFLGTAPQLQARHSQKSGVPFSVSFRRTTAFPGNFLHRNSSSSP